MATTTSLADIPAESRQSPTCMARFNAAAGGVTLAALAATFRAPSLPLAAAMLEPPVAADTSFVTLYAPHPQPSTAEPVRDRQAGRHRFRSVSGDPPSRTNERADGSQRDGQLGQVPRPCGLDGGQRGADL